MSYYTYKITNLINGKIYIGKAANIKKRWNKHKTAARKRDPKDYTYLHKSMNKHGFDNFKIEQLTEHSTEEEALAQETVFIKQFQSRDRDIGYNMTDGGDGACGYKFTDEQRKKMSEAKKGRYTGEDNHFYGKHHTDEFKEIHSQIMKEKYQSDPEKYDLINMQQCSLDTEQCIEIQKKYMQKDISMEKLAEIYSVQLTAIFHIIHGTYFAIRGHSILSENQIEEIIQNQWQQFAIKYRKFTIEQEKEIVEKYQSNVQVSLTAISKEYQTSTTTIRKILKAANIAVRKKAGGGARRQHNIS